MHKPRIFLGSSGEQAELLQEIERGLGDVGPIPRVGDRVPILPGHACTTIAMGSRIVGCRDGRVERILWIDGNERRQARIASR